MKNKIEDLRNHMFAALERLGTENISEEELRKEVERARAISELGKVIVESAKTEILYSKVTGKQQPEAFMKASPNPSKGGELEAPKKIERPKAEYSNHRPYEFAK